MDPGLRRGVHRGAGAYKLSAGVYEVKNYVRMAESVADAASVSST